MELICLVEIGVVTLLATLLAITMAYGQDKHRWLRIVFIVVSAMVAIFFIVKSVETSRVKEPLELNKGIFSLVAQSTDANTASLRILNLVPKGWDGTYAYKVNCLEVRGGCPSPWPSNFESFRDSEGKLNIVSLENNP